MKRVNNLYPVLISDTNLERAIQKVNLTHRWNHYPDKPNKTVLWVESTKNDRIKELRKIIEEGFVPSPITIKHRYDRNAKKWRDICEPKLWPDQYIHHALIQVIEPVMMRGMDRWCCGSISGRGAHYGIRAIKKWMKETNGKNNYCLEADIKHFYDSLSPEKVLYRMKCLIKDNKTLDLIERIIADGILIGLFCSQWFANTFLQPLDHVLREHFHVSHYIRYMDNFTIFSNRRRTLFKVKQFMDEWLHNMGLELKSNWQIFSTKHRVPNALGYRYGFGYTLLRKSSLLNLKKQLRQYYKRRERGWYISVRFAQGLLSRLGMLRHSNSVNLYAKLVKKHTQRHLKDIVRKWQKSIVGMTWEEALNEYKKEVVLLGQ